MKQYTIQFFKNRKDAPPSTYFREFETLKELKLWATDILKEDHSLCRYTYKAITIEEFLLNT